MNGKTNAKYDRTSINFGVKGDISRTIKEMIIENFGSQALSGAVRRSLVVCYSDDPKFKAYKIKNLTYEYKELRKKIAREMEEKCELGRKLESLGVNLDEI